MDHSVINKLEQQVLSLVDAYQQAKNENDELRNKYALLNQEKKRLFELNKSAAEKIKTVAQKIKQHEG